MTTKMTKKDETAAIATLEKICEESSLAKFVDLKPIARAVAVANSIMEIRKGLEPVLHKFLALQNNSLGFRTDQDNGYHANIVKDAIAEALLRGLPPSGNHFNIIAKRMYITKEGMLLSVSTWPGVSDVTPDVGQPAEIQTTKQKSRKGYETTVLGAYMPFHCTWKLNGEDKELATSVYCRAYAGDSAMDALQGKAYRKGLAKVLMILQGHTFSVPEGELGELDVQDQPKDITPPADKPKTKKQSVKEKLDKAAKAEAPAPEVEAPPKEEIEPPASTDGDPGPTEPESELPQMSLEACKRVQKAAKVRWSAGWAKELEDWCEFHYETRDLMGCPLYAETELLKYISKP